MKIFKKTFVDILNLKYLIKHGSDTPVYKEMLTVNPDDIVLKMKQKTSINKISKIRRISGCVVDTDWDLHAESKSNDFKEKAIAERYVKGKSWHSTGIFEYQLGRLENVTDDVIVKFEERYKKLDEVYSDIKKAGKLSSKEEHLISVCIGRYGQLIHFGQGAHRLAIAKILRLPKIPVIIGVVHPQGIPYLKKYRTK